jgi:hypothetical protein
MLTLVSSKNSNTITTGLILLHKKHITLHSDRQPNLHNSYLFPAGFIFYILFYIPLDGKLAKQLRKLSHQYEQDLQSGLYGFSEIQSLASDAHLHQNGPELIQ